MAENPIPFSAAAELSVLGAALLEADLLAEVAILAEEMFYFTPNRILHRTVSNLWRSGKTPDVLLLVEELKREGKLDEVGGLAYLQETMEAGASKEEFHQHLTLVREKYAMREVMRIGEGMLKAVQGGKHSPQKIVDHALTRLTSVITHAQSQQGLKTREDFVAHELARMNKPEGSGVTLPFEKIGRFTGDLLPGDAIAIPGYSNSGKTLLAANFAKHWAIKQYPAIWFPTESQEKFLGRIAASHARIPQAFPERDSWHQATQEQREAFEFALRDLQGCPWDIVPKRRLSVDEIIAETTVRRRKYDGQPVIVVVDHMHRLNYGNRQMAFAVSEDTQRLRDWAGEDRHGGIILVLLYQPKKPEIDINVYKPVLGYGISGTGQTMAELDIILSPYRRWVKCSPEAANNPLHRTPWGTARCLYKGSFPEYAKPEAEGAKLDDEHVYVKIAKRRTGGEGPTAILNIDAPSGHIYQLGAEEQGLVVAR